MLVAAYAPLKPPDHPVPSGDRRVARLLDAALVRAGHRVVWPSRFRSRDGVGDRLRQLRLALLGGRLADRILRRFVALPTAHRPQAWITYHLYHKAPDHLGPTVARGLGIPYIVVEASLAAKQLGGKWDMGHRAAAAALGHASAIVSLNPADVPAIDAFRNPRVPHYLLPPFLAADAYAQSLPRKAGPARLLAVGMMRKGDKRRSYAVLAQALAKVKAPWQLAIAGDGPMRAEIEADFAPFGERVRFHGECDEAKMAALRGAGDVFVWPAIGEAFGMALLEAQASGLPAVAGITPGVAAIVADGRTGLLATLGDAEEFAKALTTLCIDTDLRAAMGRAAFAKVREQHDIAGAAELFDRILRRRA
jgi:glycosyltransferase involved in cell wall biosynthesis